LTSLDFITADWNHLKTIFESKCAALIVEIGQIGLATK
jgi:hypothetical protein